MIQQNPNTPFPEAAPPPDNTGTAQSAGPVTTAIASIELPPEGFQLTSGEYLPALDVAYETYGTLSAEKDNALFICHALTGDAHVAGYHEIDDPGAPGQTKRIPGWWDDMVGPGKGIDTQHYFVVCANILGGCKGTTGPSSINPRTGKPHGSGFPQITVTDIVNVHRLLLEHLGITRLAGLVGGSLGGMQVLDWALKYPDSMKCCICIASAASLSTQALAFDVIGRNAITTDPNWQGGDYYGTGSVPHTGLALARKIGHITYLSHEMLTQKFGRDKKAGPNTQADAPAPDRPDNKFQSDFEIESYLAYQGQKFVNRFDANSYLHITEAIDDFDLAEGYGSLENAFQQLKAKCLVVALSKDWLFTPEQSADIANALLRAGKSISFCRLYAPHGHDAFLVDIEHLSQVIRAFLPWVNTKVPAEPGKPDGQTESRPDQVDTIVDMIHPGAHVLDLGCGNGALLDVLKQEKKVAGMGVDLAIDDIITVIDKGHDIFQMDLDAGLATIPDQTYDYALLSDTLQVLHKPRIVLQELVRVAREGIISFPNFGHWRHRLRLLTRGRMPKSGALPYEWYNTPNIHLFTLKDFYELCASENLAILDMVCLARGPVSRGLRKLGLCNLGADRAVVRITRRGPGDKTGKHAAFQCTGKCCQGRG